MENSSVQQSQLGSIRATVIYTGRVQGVGFRWQVNQIAKFFSCSGFVKNLSDGTVELVVEGTGREVRGMVEKVNDRMQDYWHEIKIDERTGYAHFSEFSIQY
ncbi:acylphosphatase [Opitutales bacterium]|uniref:acylphosphatase n=1 Tax=Candidatus Chordibacter forsetii TaxID=3381758 RepID=UPI002324BA68|nr:acylphosphatase [Opitutales bacterium]